MNESVADSKDSPPDNGPVVVSSSSSESADRWKIRRIWIAGVMGAMLPETYLILGFLPLLPPPFGFARILLDLSQWIQFLTLVCFLVGLSSAAVIALWRRQFRLAASSLLACVAIPVCFSMVFLVPLFRPWLWYAMANNNRFERLAASGPPSSALVVECRDVSVGFVSNYSHFVYLVYDESNAVGLKPSKRPSTWKFRTIIPEILDTPVPRGELLWGHTFMVDEFK